MTGNTHTRTHTWLNHSPLACLSLAFSFQATSPLNWNRCSVVAWRDGFLFFFPSVLLSRTEDQVWIVIQHNNTELTAAHLSHETNQHVAYFGYAAGEEQLAAILSQSEHCEQELSFHCRKSRLFSTPGKLEMLMFFCCIKRPDFSSCVLTSVRMKVLWNINFVVGVQVKETFVFIDCLCDPCLLFFNSERHWEVHLQYHCVDIQWLLVLWPFSCAIFRSASTLLSVSILHDTTFCTFLDLTIRF